MEQAWELEEALWAAAATGEVNAYYANILDEHATVIGPGYRLTRDDVVERCTDRGVELSEYRLSDKEARLANPDTLILTYRILARSPILPGPYSAQVSSVYVCTPDGWALALRQHSVDPTVPAEPG